MVFNSLNVNSCNLMVRYCSECGKEGGFFEFDIKTRVLPLSKARMLCLSCYDKIFAKENPEYQKIVQQKKAENEKIMKWKNRILRSFYEGTVKQLCHEKGISIMEKRWTTATSRRGTTYDRQYNYYFTYEQLIPVLMNSVSLNDLLDFAKKKNIPVRDIELEVDQYYAKKKQVQEPHVPQMNDDVYKKILEKIDLFKPLLPYYPNELSYQLDLGRYLLQYFPTAKLEQQRSSARPDITIDNIAIEIKGPTYEEGLRSIADKCLRYPLYFEKGLIIVLFDVKVTSRYIEDWQKGLQNKFPHVVIRCK
jgi:hypothetical protein